MPHPVYAPLTDGEILHPGRAARAVASDVLAGRVGELHPALIDELGLRASQVIVAELAVAGLSGGQPAVPLGRTPSRHPVVERDLAVVVAGDRPAGEVEAVVRRHAGPLLASVELFDIYRGRPLPDDRRSLAFRLVFAAADRTLTEDEVDRAVADVTEGLASDVDGHLRT
jgi:phenylalanyl-tRNA synthetase beta chain